MMTKSDIATVVQNSNRAAEIAMVRIYEGQTEAEKEAGTAGELNGAGFNKFDAKIGCSLAEQVLAGKRLTEKQLEVARKIAVRHWRQLAAAAERKAARKYGAFTAANDNA